MLDLCQNSAHSGGTVLEVLGKDKIRRVETFNDPGPETARRNEGERSPLNGAVADIIEREKGSSG
jgi:hypothetical protein